MDAFVGDFQLPRLERVVSGPDSIDGLAGELARRSVARAVVVTGRTLGGSALLTRLTRVLGHRCAAVFTGARQHVPSCSVADLVKLMEEHEADGVVSFGGGSPIDTAKAAAHAWLSRDGEAGGDGPVHIAVPTTLSAGEFTSVVGITDEKTRIKRAIVDPRLAPRTVFCDPTLTLETPPWLWVASGVRAIDHAVETMYSSRHHPFSDALASRALALLLEHLPSSLTAEGAEQLEHRSQCQIAAWMAVFGMTNAGFGLSHALGHQIGPRWDVAHGVTSCITLPHAMRFMAERAPERFGFIAAGIGLAFDPSNAKAAALAAADRIAAFISRFDVPVRLRDVEAPPGEIREIASVVHDMMNGAHALDAPVTRTQLESLLADAY